MLGRNCRGKRGSSVWGICMANGIVLGRGNLGKNRYEALQKKKKNQEQLIRRHRGEASVIVWEESRHP
jgi:hypothetical protein